MKSNEQITSLEAKIKTLIADHKRLKSLLGEAATQIRSLEQRNREQQQQAKLCEKEIARLQLLEALSGGAEDERARERARERVNRLLREIDQCIALLK